MFLRVRVGVCRRVSVCMQDLQVCLHAAYLQLGCHRLLLYALETGPIYVYYYLSSIKNDNYT